MRHRNRAPRYERNLAIAGIAIMGLEFVAQFFIPGEDDGATTVAVALALGALFIVLCIRSFVRWRRGSIDHPSFAWFSAIAFGSDIVVSGLYVLVVALAGGRASNAVAFLLFIGCIALGVVGVRMLKRLADKRASREYQAWKRATTLPPPPPEIDL